MARRWSVSPETPRASWLYGSIRLSPFGNTGDTASTGHDRRKPGSSGQRQCTVCRRPPCATYRWRHTPIRGGARLVQPKGKGGRVPCGDKPHGASHPGSLPFNSARNSGSREQAHPGRTTPREPISPVRTATLGQTRGRRRPGGGSKAAVEPDEQTLGSRGFAGRRDSSKIEVGEDPYLSGQGICREGGRSPGQLEVAGSWKDRDHTV